MNKCMIRNERKQHITLKAKFKQQSLLTKCLRHVSHWFPHAALHSTAQTVDLLASLPCCMPHFHVACEGFRRSLAPRTMALLAPALALTSWFKSSACASSSSYLLLEQEVCVVQGSKEDDSRTVVGSWISTNSLPLSLSLYIYIYLLITSLARTSC